MDFCIADTFTASLAKLTGDEQKAVKTTAFDLQINPANPGMSVHKLDRARDKNFWSVRVNADIRIIVHRTEGHLLLCYVDHHDKAYHWAERRKLETHPKTGAAQLVEIRELVREQVVPVYVKQPVPAPAKPVLFARWSDDELLAYGVPAEWLADVRSADEDTLLTLAEHLPAEAAEALLELATGGTPQLPVVAEDTTPFTHPDAQRRFRVMANVEELERALDYPWDKWMVFLHPQQRQWVERAYNGPARISGSAGTGKTIVALHRAVYLAQQDDDARVLLTTFSEPLANALRGLLRRLIGTRPRLAERLEVHALDTVAERLYRLHVGELHLVAEDQLRDMAADALEEVTAAGVELPARFSLDFVLGEWRDVVDAWQLVGWEDYRDVKRLGRKTRLSEAQRQALWHVLSGIQQRLSHAGLITRAALYAHLSEKLAKLSAPVFDHLIMDEAQDLTIAQLRLLAVMGGGPGAMRPNSLFFAGDLGQRIFQTPFSWKALGVDVRGRARTLHINYRTSHQIRQSADRLLGPEVTDVDGNLEDRRGTVSVFNGPAPELCQCVDEADEVAAVADWLRARCADGLAPHEIAVFVRSEQELARGKAALDGAAIPYRVLDERVDIVQGQASLSTMHLAKGLEFRAVAVMACDDEVIPSQARIDEIYDEADLEEVYNTERHLLYVACTRARDHLRISGIKPVSEFLDDLQEVQ